MSGGRRSAVGTWLLGVGLGVGLGMSPGLAAGQGVPASLPDAPQPVGVVAEAAPVPLETAVVTAGEASPVKAEVPQAAEGTAPGSPAAQTQPLGPDGKPIRPQTGRIFGVFPNFVAVSGGTKPRPAGWKNDFVLANKQAYDYSSFGFLLMSSAIAYGENSHPSLNTVNGGDAIFWAYLWRGFLDKTDGSYQGTFFFPALLHEDTRYFAQGTGPAKKRLLHAVLSVVVAHNYDGKPIFNLAGQLGRAGAQAVSTTYYPAGSESFGVLAEKFAYSNMRNVIYAVVREFSPDAQAFVSRHPLRHKDQDQ